MIMPARTDSLRRASLTLLGGFLALLVQPATADDGQQSSGLTADAPAIHQETVISATCARVYGALTSARDFESITRLSDAAELLTAANAKVTAISSRAGGAFTLFGGYITGRNLELVPGKRLVQAWRAGGWDAGDYSVVRFELRSESGGCRILFDQRGFPPNQGKSLAYGWRVHYWEPLSKFLSGTQVRKQ
jgi:activator of HSP90 ATPase